MFQNLKFRTQLFTGNGLILGLMIVISIVVYMSVNSLLQTFNMVNHTHEVLAEASAIEASAVDMETGMRGYLLAGQEGFLDPYTGGDKKFQEMVTKLSKTVDDNPAQVQLLKETRENIDQWKKNVTEPTIELRRQIGDAQTMNDMAELIQQANGKKYFDKFRGQVATFIEREATLMKKRQEKAKTSTNIDELRQLTSWVTHTYEVIASAESILAAGVDMETGMRGFLLAGKDEFLEPYTGGKRKFFGLVASLSKTVDDNPAQVALLGEMKVTITGWIEKVVEEQIALRRAIGDAKTMDDMADLVGEAKGKVYFDKFRGQIKTFKEREESLMGVRMDSLDSTSGRTINVAIFGTLLAVILGIGIVIFLTRNIMKQLGGEPAYIADIAKNVGAGDLNIELKSTGKDEGVFAEMKTMMSTLRDKAELAIQISKGDLTQDVNLASERDILGKALKEMSDNLNRIIAEVNSAAEQIASGSGQVSDSSQSLSQGASESAASLEQITSSMTEMAAQTKTNAENSGQANQLSGQARDAAEKGNEHMNDLVKAIDEINESGQSISKIIKVIDEIAFQTNLLALNAAVEAARAGKHGKGFAVVAEEVRNLAARSAKAAQETAELIEGSVEKAKNGTEIAGRTSEALAEIVSGATKVTDLIGEIAAASNEQAQGIAQVNQGLSQIEQVTQTNTASSEEGAAAAEELTSQAEHLKGLMATFTIKDGNIATASSSMQRALPQPQRSSQEWNVNPEDEAALNPKPEEVISLDDNEFGKY
jgi:methyl-accepting chemotaxis protein